VEVEPKMGHFFAAYSLFTGRPALRTLGKRFRTTSATFAELHTTKVERARWALALQDPCLPSSGRHTAKRAGSGQGRRQLCTARLFPASWSGLDGGPALLRNSLIPMCCPTAGQGAVLPYSDLDAVTHNRRTALALDVSAV
jgi:hypothetical protein